MKAKIIESAANEERAIVEQMGDMASFMRAEDGKQKGEAMTTNQTTDGVPRRVCHACVSYPRDAYCPVCDPATQGEQVARITLQQVLKAYDYANCHPNKYLRGTSNWCAAVAHSLNTK